MGQYRDILPTESGWIHDLARSEIHPDAEKLLQLGRSLDPQQLVEESTINFLGELRDAISKHLKLFNGYSDQGQKFQEVKIYRLAHSAADFMIFRNQVKLIFSNSAHGVIQINFARHVTGGLGINGQGGEKGQTSKTNEIVAQVSPFRNIFWTYQGEKITAEEVARFYFSEFVRATRNTKPSSSGNELLLEQVKSLLKEKGLDI